ncbi:MAG: hypothetical protein J7497_14610, partial [Chitinophagaceae bacterium]|nr:hypothetical protein [Chitinophagaceae bacterium]
MAMTPQHIAQLLYARLNGTLTDKERVELDAWMSAPDRSPVFASDMDDEAVIARWTGDFENEQRSNGRQIVLQRILEQVHASKMPMDNTNVETGQS